MSTGTWLPIIRCRTVVAYRQRHAINIASEPQPPQPPPSGPWIQVNGGHISVGILVRFTSFLGTLHWPAGSDDFASDPC